MVARVATGMINQAPKRSRFLQANDVVRTELRSTEANVAHAGVCRAASCCHPEMKLSTRQENLERRTSAGCARYFDQPAVRTNRCLHDSESQPVAVIFRR